MAIEPGITVERDWVVAPGEILQEALDDRGMSQSDLARRMGRPIKTINEIVNGKAAITPDTAIQLELALGISAAFWNNLEATYRAHLARTRSEQELAAYASWAAAFPIKDLVQNNLIRPASTKGGKVAALLAYFRVSTPEAWKKHWLEPAVAYRASPAFASRPQVAAAWLRWGEILAEGVETEPFDPRRLSEVLTEIRGLVRKDFALTRQRIHDLLAGAGVALVLTPEFKDTHLSGAARWIGPDKALIQLSLRFKTDDHFWFSLFHEGRHLLEDKRVDYVDAEPAEGESKDTAEREADRFARDTLIPAEAYAAFLATATFTEDAIRRFAKDQGVPAGVVVGRLQHDHHLDPSHLNDLKKPVRFGQVL
ncbi:MAG: HigA family addiction module antitoxin [Solirubrobacteraceae bacterium]